MYWEERSDDKPFAIPDDVVDLAFNISCRCLPLDHAYALSHALLDALPWLADEEDAGIHLIHGAASGNGWYAPDEGDSTLLYLSRRTRLTLRLPMGRVDDAGALTGRTLDIDGHALQVGRSSVRPLSSITTLFARHVVAREGDGEEQFIADMAGQLRGMGIPFRKMLCGKSHVLRMPQQQVLTRSLMIADLDVTGAVRLQQKGLGPGRKIGCGLFVPHKSIDSLKKQDQD
jgi:CRISPR-associated protein Cas6